MARTRKSAIQRPDVSAHSDPRTFVHDFIEYRKQGPGGFSYRKLAAETGIALGYLHMMLSGKRPMDASHVPALARAFGLRPDEQRFFAKLVELLSTDSPEQKQQLIRSLSRRSAFRDRFALDPRYLDYLATWLTGTILELVDLPDFSPDETWLAAKLRPKVAPLELRAAWSTLVALRLVEQDSQGHWQRQQRTLQAPNEGLGAEIVAAYHSQRLKLAQWALQEVDGPDRNFGAITARVTPEVWRLLQQKMHDVRLDVVRFLEQHDSPAADVVVHINWQSFPVTHGRVSSASTKDDHDA